jgi:DNA-binding transcriptional MerR regulator
MDPPYLLQRSGEPVYDAADVARMVGVTTDTLTDWEARYGVPRPRHLMDESGVMRPRYSERDMLATLWLTEQLRAGQPPDEAARRLLAAQQAPPGATYGPAPTVPTPAVAPNSRGWSGPTTYAPSTPSLRKTSGPLVEVAPRTPNLSRPLADVAPRQARTSGPLTARQSSVSLPLSGSGALPWPAPGTAQAGQSIPWPATGTATGRLRGDGSLSGAYGPYGAHSTGGIRMLAGALLQAIVDLDPNEARRVLDEAQNQLPLETVLLRLVQPVGARLGELVQAGHLSPGTERFGYTTLRNRLATLLDALVAPLGAPLTLVACAPGEHGELEAMVQTILWRKANLRSIYLGAVLTDEALAALVRERRPRVLYLLAATEPGARAVSHVADGLARVEPPRPLLGFGGAAFVRAPQWQTRVRGGYFLGADAMLATRHLLQMLQDGPLTPR